MAHSLRVRENKIKAKSESWRLDSECNWSLLQNILPASGLQWFALFEISLYMLGPTFLLFLSTWQINFCMIFESMWKPILLQTIIIANHLNCTVKFMFHLFCATAFIVNCQRFLYLFAASLLNATGSTEEKATANAAAQDRMFIASSSTDKESVLLRDQTCCFKLGFEVSAFPARLWISLRRVRRSGAMETNNMQTAIQVLLRQML